MSEEGRCQPVRSAMGATETQYETGLYGDVPRLKGTTIHLQLIVVMQGSGLSDLPLFEEKPKLQISM